MADEGLVLAVRSKARLGQVLSSAQHAESHLQVVGVGRLEADEHPPLMEHGSTLERRR